MESRKGDRTMYRRKFLSTSAALLGSAGVGLWLSRQQGWWKGQTPDEPKRRQPIGHPANTTSSATQEGTRRADFTENWERLARDKDIETVRKRIDETYVKNGEFKADQAGHLKRWLEQRNIRPRSILDFGCGLGRNFPTWRRMADTVTGYDLPAMVDRCRPLDLDVDLLTSDWSALRNRQFSLIAAILVLQHMAVDELREKLADMRRMTPLLFVLGRWYSDDHKRDVMQIVLESGFVVLASDFPRGPDGTRVPSWKGESHWTALFSSDVGDTRQGNTTSSWRWIRP